MLCSPLISSSQQVEYGGIAVKGTSCPISCFSNPTASLPRLSSFEPLKLAFCIPRTDEVHLSEAREARPASTHQHDQQLVAHI